MMFTLKQARMLKEVTQDEMAQAIGVHVQTYRAIESCPERATIKQAKILAKKLGMDYNQIFFGADSSLTRETAS